MFWPYRDVQIFENFAEYRLVGVINTIGVTVRLWKQVSKEMHSCITVPDHWNNLSFMYHVCQCLLYWHLGGVADNQETVNTTDSRL
ncbi:hypothetical protein DPX16_22421 [Anabarilius grahami]|uniref:Uncharacterized protein n=1 Tax=Anabarilius grahami TaxID=495550 RepID=A0A3N0YYF3_ANAGA|nr:hypothetical protein DPX16_22421 [Anabarilius grahami]